jgi:hypothetical protein
MEGALSAQAARVRCICLMRALVLALLLASSAPSGAAECAAPAGAAPSLAHIDAVDRLRFLQGALRHGARRARIWSWAWGSGYATLATLNLVLLSVYDPSKRVDLYVGAAASTVGVLAVSVVPLKVMRDQRWFDARVRAGGDVCALVADGERLLARDAASEAFGKSWLIHVGSFAFNVGLGLLLSVGFGHQQAGVIDSFAGLTLGEIMILTQPADSVAALARYRRAELMPAPPRAAWQLTPVLAPDRRGFAFSLAF